jgi:hypothetical protein
LSCRAGWLAPSSVIDLHPQSSIVGLISAETPCAITRRHGAGTRVNQIIAPNACSVTLSQPYRDLDEASPIPAVGLTLGIQGYTYYTMYIQWRNQHADR